MFLVKALEKIAEDKEIRRPQFAELREACGSALSELSVALLASFFTFFFPLKKKKVLHAMIFCCYHKPVWP